MVYKNIKIILIQILLNLSTNITYFFLTLIFFLLIFIFSIFGFWNLLSGYSHLFALLLLLTTMVISIIFFKSKFKVITFKNTVHWLEKENFSNINPLLAITDKPVGENINLPFWNLHLEQTKKNIKNLKFYIPKINLNSADPLKIRFIIYLFLFVSIFWATYNNVLYKNLSNALKINFEKNNNINENFKVLAWLNPPNYTGLLKKDININSVLEKKLNTLNVPFSSDFVLQTIGINPNKIKITLDETEKKIITSGTQFNTKFKILKNNELKFIVDNKVLFNLYFNIIEDSKPKVEFLSSPEIVNAVSLKFSTKAIDDYGVIKANVSFSKPEEFKHFVENKILFDLQILSEGQNKVIKNLFFENMSSHIWAGNKSTIKVSVYDDLNQQGFTSREITIPEKTFISEDAQSIYRLRSELAKTKISISEAKEKLVKVFSKNKKLGSDILVNNNYNLVLSNLNDLKNTPLSYNAAIYKNLWQLASSIEDGKSYLVKNNLEQVEQNLFDSINQRETEKISTNVEKFKETIQSLIDLNNQEGKNSLVNNEKNKRIKDEINKATKALEDLLKMGSKKNLSEKIQELKQLAESIKNPMQQNQNEVLKEQKKRDFINKLSELLNEQEIIMEESFNEAANRGKFKQSSEGSGGRTSKEKQENLRNTLGNIMRDIGESENEIPQELGRADRAMRQATRELENGRPDQASNAQGRAAEMLQRAMNKMRYSDNLSENPSYKDDDNDFSNDNQNSFSKAYNDLEYQGTSLGGRIEIPENQKIQKAKQIAKELYNRYNENDRSVEDKIYIKNLLDWY